MIYSYLLPLALAGAAYVHGRHLEHGAQVPGKWVHLSDAPDLQQIELTFALKLRNTEELHDKLLAVSTPSSKSYGRHLSLEEVNDLTSPSAASIESVKDYIRSFGGKTITYSSGFVRTVVDIEIAEKMLSADYSLYKHMDTSETAVRCSQYELPDKVAALVDFVAPSKPLPLVLTFPHTFHLHDYVILSAPYTWHVHTSPTFPALTAAPASRELSQGYEGTAAVQPGAAGLSSEHP